MNKKIGIIVGVLVLLLVGTGVVVYKAIFSGPAPAQPSDSIIQTQIPPVDSSIQVSLTKSASTANSVTVDINGMKDIASVEYELQYQGNGVGKGVTGTVKDVNGKTTLSREIYLGTCSKNVCTPDKGVTAVTLNLVFTDTSGKQSQFSKDYTL